MRIPFPLKVFLSYALVVSAAAIPTLIYYQAAYRADMSRRLM